MDFYAKAKSLLFHHVDIVTNIRRARDFAESPFVPQRTHEDDEKLLVYSGHLKVIDPTSKSVILCQHDGERITRNILILGQNICDIRKSEGETPKEDAQTSAAKLEKLIEFESRARLAEHPFFARAQSSPSQEELKATQTAIVEWFRKYMIPVELNSLTQEIIIAESVRIRPPYEHESDYISPTRVALKRIKHMVDSVLLTSKG